MTLFQYDFITFGLKDVVDVLIVGFIIYQILKLVRGTRSAQIVVGLSLIAGVAFVAYWFQLEGLTWLFSTLAPFGLIMLVIVFQPELRGVLAQMGQNRFLRRFVNIQYRKTIDEVNRAVLRLAELNYGGLIVIERNTGLRNFAESGKLMNAELSAELLVTLFTPYTPLHDGAVIISGDFVVAAASSLPLTTNLRYRKLFGMRHKAAIGVSDVSDAVVVVVSEETSRISIAHNGILDSNIMKSKFKTKLTEYLKE
ncbi:MAG: diadenylate cyclase CdaA [candidate division Zixibacteria bacterium]|nr:diadenylate cyclase CdaA [candidate division Zixibacteria bacterium]